MIKTIGILTSGGDAPGMNAAIRALVLTASQYGLSVIGFKHGFNGIFQREYLALNTEDVRQIGHLGGTILKSARCKALPQPGGPAQAAEILHELGIDALLVIGGDGSFRGCVALSHYYRGQIVGLPGTIDNDLDGTDLTIGFATALETALDAIDKIRDTADAFERTFLVEVMGRHTGYLALSAGIAGSAEQIICPEYGETVDIADIAADIRDYQSQHGACSYIIVLAETMFPAGAAALAQELSEQSGTECRAVVLGHLQRGGRPVGSDRILATKLGAFAIEQLMAGHAHLMMVGEQAGQTTMYPLALTGEQHKKADPFLLAWQDRVLQQHKTDA